MLHYELLQVLSEKNVFLIAMFIAKHRRGRCRFYTVSSRVDTDFKQ